MHSTIPLRERVLNVVAWWLPTGCLGCGDRLPGVAPFNLCVRCRGELRPPRRGCPGCGWEMTAPGTFRCERCRHDPPPFDRRLSLWRFEGPCRRVMHGLKFGGLTYLGEQIAAELERTFAAELRRTEVVVPVPLHPWRRLLRGYNQAGVIARPLARLLGARPANALIRRRATPPQTGLDRRTRHRNLAGAFFVLRRRAVSGRRILLVDDVATTGATLRAAAAALRRAGAASTIALTAAATPADRTPGSARAGSRDRLERRKVHKAREIAIR